MLRGIALRSAEGLSPFVVWSTLWCSSLAFPLGFHQLVTLSLPCKYIIAYALPLVNCLCVKKCTNFRIFFYTTFLRFSFDKMAKLWYNRILGARRSETPGRAPTKKRKEGKACRPSYTLWTFWKGSVFRSFHPRLVAAKLSSALDYLSFIL